MKKIITLRSLLAIALVGAMAFACVGCLGGSDGDGDGDPTGTDFTDATALSIGVPTATLQSGIVMNAAIAAAGGFGAARDYTYVWDTDEQAYYADLDDTEGNTTWTGFIRAQFLDGGTPVDDIDLADLANLILDLNIVTSESGSTIEADYDFDVDVTGMGSGTLTIAGTGGYAYEVDYSGLSTTYLATWETVAPGHVSMPEGGGCPTGEILYTMTPYTMSIVYDGTPKADYTVYDDSGAPISNGTGTIAVGCSTN